MGWMFKAALTAVMVFGMAEAARQLGQRAAGMMAALPIITAPTLAWVSHEQGVAFAVSVAVGSVAATAVMAMFALFYARGARHGSVVSALICGLAGAVVIAFPAAAVSSSLGEAIALSLACCFLALAHLRSEGKRSATAHRSRLPLTTVALVAGVLSALAVTIGPGLGGFATGLLSSLPLIGGGVAIIEHATIGPRAAEQFLHGYVRGLFGKTAFGAVFALLAVIVGAPTALLLAAVSACAFSLPRRRASFGLSTR